MVQESPLMPVSKPRRNPAGRVKSPSASRRTGGAGRKRSRRGKKEATGKTCLEYAGVAPVCGDGECGGVVRYRFLLFFIRPYAYRWKPCYARKHTVYAFRQDIPFMDLIFPIIRETLIGKSFRRFRTLRFRYVLSS